MPGLELTVEQDVAAQNQTRHQVHQADLAGVPLGRKHAFSKERPVDGNPVEPTDQPPIQPSLDAVGLAAAMQLPIELLDGPVDPGLAAPGRLGAGRHDLVETLVEGDLEAVRANRAGQARRDVEFTRDNDAAGVGFDEEDPGVVPGLPHGEDPPPVAIDQIVRGEAFHTQALASPLIHFSSQWML